jgi:hypothetical protein
MAKSGAEREKEGAAWNGAGLERSQSSAVWAGLWIFNAPHFHPPAGAECLSAAMPAYPESASLEPPFKLATTEAE